MYPHERDALEVIAKLAGWDGKSTALREFSKIWIEVAVVTLESGSSLKGMAQWLKSAKRLQEQVKTVERNAKEQDKELLAEHDLELLKKAIA
jgi:hypothetical protein